MTQYFAYRGFRLSRASFSTRVLITAFMGMMLLAVALGVVNYRLRTGLSADGTVAWYRGNADAAEPVDELLFAKSALELMDVTHPHLFEESFLFFILCHIFALTRVRSRTKSTVYIASFGAVLLDCAGPWLIRFVSPRFAPLQVLSPMLLSALVLLLIAVPLKEMWWDERGPREGSRRTPAG